MSFIVRIGCRYLIEQLGWNEQGENRGDPVVSNLMATTTHQSIATGNATRQSHASAHRETTDLSIREVTRLLTNGLGTHLTAFIVGRAEQTVRRWIDGTQDPGVDVERVLRNTLHIFKVIEQADGTRHVARSWFIGMNPQLDDHSPAEMIRAGGHREVVAAARAYVSGG